MSKEILIFTASFCKPCQTLKESIAQHSEWFNQNGIPITVYDIEQEFELAQQYNIRAVPTIYILEDKKIVTYRTGVSSILLLKKDLGYDN